MSPQELVTQPLSPERSLYMREAASEALDLLRRFSGDEIKYGPTALQLLDEWIERLARRNALSPKARGLVLSFVGHTFLHAHGGHWATTNLGGHQVLGVVCPVVGSGDQTKFINIAQQVQRRFANGIRDSLALFYLQTSVELKGRF
jgi:hypothetical protein